MTIRTVLFDFGGVIAEEGFREGLLAIGRQQGLDPEAFFHHVERLIAATGYLTGRADEPLFWSAVRNGTGIKCADADLRREILRRFVVRQEMLDEVDRIRASGRTVAMLSDQTNWLDELDRAHGFFRRFDRVFNSFHLHKSKQDPSVFTDVCAELGAAAGETLFIDDNAGHIERAASRGLETLHFTTVHASLSRLRGLL